MSDDSSEPAEPVPTETVDPADAKSEMAAARAALSKAAAGFFGSGAPEKRTFTKREGPGAEVVVPFKRGRSPD
jgi:hypothetical protein